MVIFPVSAIATPPWQVMISDGQAEPRGLLRENFDPVPQDSVRESAP
jgi:hypothetical protein